MKIKKIEISIKEKFFLKYGALNDKDLKKNLEKERSRFLEEAKNIEIIENREISNVDSDGKADGYSKSYSGFYIKYYEGTLQIEGEQSKNTIFMRISLTKSIMNLVLKEAGGEIKELVKKEYQEFENQLYQLIDRTEKKNVFGNFVVSKFKKLKETILDNSNKG